MVAMTGTLDEMRREMRREMRGEMRGEMVQIAKKEVEKMAQNVFDHLRTAFIPSSSVIICHITISIFQASRGPGALVLYRVSYF